ncbi:SacI homology domain-containing protein [Jimgerdemannia flammicorona]|uniref:SacI homology domain-containing protein n=1 Tax=Jimgerdemannia flammicorona TaxID=994334 RepID=A0A433QKZ4_9FUNG|nr:SacI homology domain-containing protein [Jimgerdemannia flammicorona]
MSATYIDEPDSPAPPYIPGRSQDKVDNASTPTSSIMDNEDRSQRCYLTKFTLYETKSRYYLVGSNQADSVFRVLKIDRTSPVELTVIVDDTMYTKQEVVDLLMMIEYGNRTGGLSKVASAWGIIGFVRFTEGYYISLITKRSVVALIGGHYVYHIDETELVPIGQASKLEKNSEEARYMNTFRNVDLTRNFYFSYTYDLTHTLQYNMTRPPQTADNCESNYNDMFIWNHYLLENGFKSLKTNSEWILPIVHGFVEQTNCIYAWARIEQMNVNYVDLFISVFGRNVFIALIARRSRHFAGARYLKRGVSDKGYVANDVETEQIIAEMSTTSFHTYDRLFGNPRYTSYVQHRGSIPLNWSQRSQDNLGMAPKPLITLNCVDPFYTASALHFDDMFKRYGTPCIVLNLIKVRIFPSPSCINRIFLLRCPGLSLKTAKGKGQTRINLIGRARRGNQILEPVFAGDAENPAYRLGHVTPGIVIGFLENIAEKSLQETGFFHSGPEPYINVLRREQA